MQSFSQPNVSDPTKAVYTQVGTSGNSQRVREDKQKYLRLVMQCQTLHKKKEVLVKQLWDEKKASNILMHLAVVEARQTTAKAVTLIE